MVVLQLQTKMCEQSYLLIIGYGFWGTLKDMSWRWVTSLTCVTSLKENFIALAPFGHLNTLFHLHWKMKANKKRYGWGVAKW